MKCFSWLVARYWARAPSFQAISCSLSVIRLMFQQRSCLMFSQNRRVSQTFLLRTFELCKLKGHPKPPSKVFLDDCFSLFLLLTSHVGKCKLFSSTEFRACEANRTVNLYDTLRSTGFFPYRNPFVPFYKNLLFITQRATGAQFPSFLSYVSFFHISLTKPLNTSWWVGKKIQPSIHDRKTESAYYFYALF